MQPVGVICAEFIGADVRQDVGVHERDCGSVCQEHRRRRRKSEVVARQVRVPARVDHERVLQPAQAVQYNESWRAARF